MRSPISAPASCSACPQPVILMFAVFIIGGIVLNFTRFGRLITAIGSNEEAVRLSGIAVPRYILAVYVISGALAAVAGIISTSRTGVGSAQVGVGAELNVIAAVVIGGASLMGGRGGVINTLLGALVMGIIANIMNLAGVPGYHQQVYMGLIIVVAMLIQYGTGSLALTALDSAMARDLTLSIDVGTGSVRAALVDRRRRDPPHRGARARPDRAAIRLGRAAAARLVGRRRPPRSATSSAAVDGARRAHRRRRRLRPDARHGAGRRRPAGRRATPRRSGTTSAPSALVAAFERDTRPPTYLAESGNPPTPAWPGFKLAWLRDNDPQAYRAAPRPC